MRNLSPYLFVDSRFEHSRSFVLNLMLYFDHLEHLRLLRAKYYLVNSCRSSADSYATKNSKPGRDMILVVKARRRSDITLVYPLRSTQSIIW